MRLPGGRKFTLCSRFPCSACIYARPRPFAGRILKLCAIPLRSAQVCAHPRSLAVPKSTSCARLLRNAWVQGRMRLPGGRKSTLCAKLLRNAWIRGHRRLPVICFLLVDEPLGHLGQLFLVRYAYDALVEAGVGSGIHVHGTAGDDDVLGPLTQQRAQHLAVLRVGLAGDGAGAQHGERGVRACSGHPAQRQQGGSERLGLGAVDLAAEGADEEGRGAHRALAQLGRAAGRACTRWPTCGCPGRPAGTCTGPWPRCRRFPCAG